MENAQRAVKVCALDRRIRWTPEAAPETGASCKP